jgi:tetratricopeptide (TPR) repeat protein
MKNSLLFLFLFLSYFNFIFSEEKICDCHEKCSFHISDHLSNLRYRTDLFRQIYKGSVSEKKYCQQILEIKSKYSENVYPLRYSNVYKDLLLFEQEIAVYKAFKLEDAKADVETFWGLNRAEKDAKLIKDIYAIEKNATRCRERLNDCYFNITNIYVSFYEGCLKKHFSLLTYQDYSRLAYLNNNFDKSFILLKEMIDRLDEKDFANQFDSLDYHEFGKICNEAMAYNLAIKHLSEAIIKDPENKLAHLERSFSYFETGAFELALEDYQLSQEGIKLESTNNYISIDFAENLLKSIAKGSEEAAKEFLPNLCNSVYGISNALWVTVTHPIDATNNFVNACHKLVVTMEDYHKNFEWSTLNGYSYEIMSLLEEFDQLNEVQKAELIGSAIGKYGVEVFATGLALKGTAGIRAYKNLKKANQILNLEALSSSNLNKTIITKKALNHSLSRESFFKSAQIEWDKQGKHVIGKHNFEPKKSIFEHKDAELLLKKHAGSGIPVRGTIGDVGYQELIDFKEFIGYNVCEITGKKTPTNWGKIHYSKTGAHIVPTSPR